MWCDTYETFSTHMKKAINLLNKQVTSLRQAMQLQSILGQKNVSDMLLVVIKIVVYSWCLTCFTKGCVPVFTSTVMGSIYITIVYNQM